MATLLARLKELEENVRELTRFKAMSLAQIESDLSDFAAAIAKTGLAHS